MHLSPGINSLLPDMGTRMALEETYVFALFTMPSSYRKPHGFRSRPCVPAYQKRPSRRSAHNVSIQCGYYCDIVKSACDRASCANLVCIVPEAHGGMFHCSAVGRQGTAGQVGSIKSTFNTVNTVAPGSDE